MSTENTQRMDAKSILCFIILTFGITYAVEFWLLGSGRLRFDSIEAQSAPALWLLAVMWIPGLVGLGVTAFVDGKKGKDLFDALALRLGTSVGPYFLTFILAPLAFLLMYGGSWLLGMSGYDPTMSKLAEISGEAISKNTLIQIMIPLSILLGPLINFVFGLGEEIGWRGFLLPRLMPLGKFNAYIILGVLWGLWHAPLIYAGFNYPGYPMLGILMMCVLATAFGFFLNEMTLHYKSSILAGFIHGAVNAQGYGIWMWLFPDANPLMGGGTGMVAVATWLVFSLATVNVLPRLKN